MKTNIKTYFTRLHKGDWSFYLLPTIWLDYYVNKKHFHGKRFVIAIGFLFWNIEIEINKH